jgi:hypothetical protein
LKARFGRAGTWWACDDYLSAARGECLCNGAADTRAAAGDQDCLSPPFVFFPQTSFPPTSFPATIHAMQSGYSGAGRRRSCALVKQLLKIHV